MGRWQPLAKTMQEIRQKELINEPPNLRPSFLPVIAHSAIYQGESQAVCAPSTPPLLPGTCPKHSREQRGPRSGMTVLRFILTRELRLARFERASRACYHSRRVSPRKIHHL